MFRLNAASPLVLNCSQSCSMASYVMLFADYSALVDAFGGWKTSGRHRRIVIIDATHRALMVMVVTV